MYKARRMKLNRTVLIRSPEGSIQIEKNKPVMVPGLLVGRIEQMGGTFVDKEDAKEEEIKKVRGAQGDPVKRRQALMNIMQVFYDRNNAADFSAAGRPLTKKIAKHLDFVPTPDEVRELWRVVVQQNDAKRTGAVEEVTITDKADASD